MGKPSKQFWDERSRKLNKKKRTSKKHIGINQSANRKRPIYPEMYTPDYIINVPECFSFSKNLEGTAWFFAYVMNQLKNSIPRSDFLIDAKHVSEVSTDAIMYLIALMRNYKESRRRLYSFHGTYPINEDAKKVFTESGLLKFVISKSKKLPENNSKMTILCGDNSNANLAKSICEFVANKLNMSNSYVKGLYEVVVEMMSNVFYHAYNDDEDSMIPEWYMYAEHIDDKVKFLFLDTGLGIGKTVKKNNLYEKIVNKIGIGSESKLIKSALDGEFRTQTGKVNHGKGLPSIKEFAFNDKIEDFHIMSGKGHCWLTNNFDDFQIEELKNNICGTIYSFTIKNAEV